MEMLGGGTNDQTTIDSTFFVIFVNYEQNYNCWPSYVEIREIYPKLVRPRPVVLNFGATAPYAALLTFREAEILRGTL